MTAEQTFNVGQPNSASINPRSVFITAAFIFLAFAGMTLLAVEASAQILDQTNTPAPPPLRFVPEDARTRLDAERDIKKRARIGLDLAEERLARAEQLTADGQFDAAAAQLGIYQALIEDTIKYIQVRGRQGGKYRDASKRMELTLRPHGPRLEVLRRATPSDEAINVKAVYDYVRGARAEALNSFYGDTVLREDPSEKTKERNDARIPKEPGQTPP